MDFDEIYAKYLNETIDFHKFKGWNSNGIKIVELESETDHGLSVADQCDDLAEGDACYLIGISYSKVDGVLTDFIGRLQNKNMDFEETKEFLSDADVIGVSKSGTYPDEVLEMLEETGAILVCSAGNDGDEGVTGKLKTIGISVGAIYLKNGEIYREGYSAYGDDELDFAVLHGFREGTSFASPTLMKMIACIKQRYPNLNKNNVYEVLKSISVDAGELGFDTSFGWGVPVLPEKIEMLEVENTNKPNKIIIHHSATDDDNYANDYDSIKWYHTVSKGWNDIGYHWLVEYDDGIKIKEGRYEVVEGAHTIGQNSQSIGICLVGNYDAYEPTKEQYATIRKLVSEIRLRWGDLPLYRHSDFANKTCPGVKFDMAEIDYPEGISEWAKDGYNYVVANGVSDGQRPKDNVTREELWTMLRRINE